MQMCPMIGSSDHKVYCLFQNTCRIKNPYREVAECLPAESAAGVCVKSPATINIRETAVTVDLTVQGLQMG